MQMHTTRNVADLEAEIIRLRGELHRHEFNARMRSMTFYFVVQMAGVFFLLYFALKC